MEKQLQEYKYPMMKSVPKSVAKPAPKSVAKKGLQDVLASMASMLLPGYWFNFGCLCELCLGVQLCLRA